MYLHWTNHILDVNYKFYLYNFPREIFARIAIFWSIFAIFGIFRRRHRMCLMGAHTFKPLSTLQGVSVLHFGGFVIAVSPLQAFTRLHENWWSSQNSSFQPTNETNNKNKGGESEDLFHLWVNNYLFSDLVVRYFSIYATYEKIFFFPVHGLVLCLGFIGFFIEPRLCAIFLSPKKIW